MLMNEHLLGAMRGLALLAFSLFFLLDPGHPTLISSSSEDEGVGERSWMIAWG